MGDHGAHCGGVSSQIEYKIIRSSRRTLAIQITRAGEVVVRAPKKMAMARIREFVEIHRDWIEKKQQEAKRKEEEFPQCTPREEAYYREQAARVLRERAAYFADQMGVTYARITIRGQKTRWGSCSSRGNLNFNWKLMLCPQEVQDYVVVHELAHLKEMNHSPAFYREVEKVLPDYRRQIQWLRVYGKL